MKRLLHARYGVALGMLAAGISPGVWAFWTDHDQAPQLVL